MAFLLQILVVFVAYVALLAPILSKLGLTIDALNYVDEALAVMAWFYVVRHFQRLTRREKNIVRLLLVILVLGVIGTLTYRYQTGFFPVVMDYFTYCKVFIVFVWANHVIGALPPMTKKKVIQRICGIMPLFIVIAFVGGIANIFVDFGWWSDTRFDHRCYSFLYPKSSTLANTFYVIMFLLMLRYKNMKKKKMNLILIICASIVWLLTLRSRAILFSILFVVMFYWIVIKERNLKIKPFLYIVVVLFGLFVTGDKIEETFSNERHPRALLLTYGIKTMVDCFPIGAGFGTYGTDMACTYYSKLYTQYGFQYAYGLNPDDTQYAHDCYWPAIMGELGIIGVVAIAVILFLMLRQSLKEYRDSRISYMIVLFLFLTQLMATLPTSVFFKDTTVFLFFLMPLIKETEKETGVSNFEWT